MKKRRIGVMLSKVLLLASIGLVGCAQKTTVVEKAPVLESAERLERRAAAAFNKGDHKAALKDYQAALQAYESLALVDAQAGVQLSMARIDAEDGRAAKALERTIWVLSSSSAALGVTAPTRLLANGRAAALYLQAQKLDEAKLALGSADTLCAAQCEAASALQTLRASWLLAGGNPAAAEQSAALAIERAVHKSDLANALRVRAQIRLVLKNYSASAQDAQAALQLDQTAGQAPRVIADLDLLVQAHEALGDTARAQLYRAQSLLAKQALQALGQK